MLTLAEYSILTAIAARVCPPARPGVPGATALDVASMVDDWENEEGYEATLLAATSHPESSDRPKTPGHRKRERGGS